MYNVGDKIVYPSYGAGIIEAIEEKIIHNEKHKYYAMAVPGSSVKVLLPVERCDELCVRPVISAEEAKKVLESFRDTPVPDDTAWNRRQRENIAKIRSGNIFEILSVLKGMMFRERLKGVSTSERKILSTVKQMIVSELILSGIADRENIENILDDIITECLENK